MARRSGQHSSLSGTALETAFVGQPIRVRLAQAAIFCAALVRGAAFGRTDRPSQNRSGESNEAISQRKIRAALASVCWPSLLRLSRAEPSHRRKKPLQPKASPPDAALNAYIARVHAENAAEVRTPGSIWIDDGLLTRLNTDVKATHVHDPISVVVVEASPPQPTER